LTSWLPRGRRARALAFAETWFSPDRWSPYDAIVALAAVALAVSVFLPWFKAAVRLSGPSGSVSGTLILPTGTVDGIALHWYLWAAFAVAVLQFGVLAARYVPGRPALRLPRYQPLMIVASGLSCVLVLAGMVRKPAPWFGNIAVGDGLSLAIEWDYGALVALGAAVISLAVAIAAVRDDPRRQRVPGY
jgi:hypothetical protein